MRVPHLLQVRVVSRGRGLIAVVHSRDRVRDRDSRVPDRASIHRDRDSRCRGMASRHRDRTSRGRGQDSLSGTET